MSEHVTITRPGAVLAADLYLPADPKQAGTCTAVIVQGP